MDYQREFFESVLPEGGLFCIARLSPQGGAAKHEKFGSVDELVGALKGRNTTKENFYFAVSSFKDPNAKKFRGQENALETRCLILDVDVKDKEGYVTSQEEALPLIESLCEAVGFPKPIIVNSGYGYHVYWPFTKAIPSDEWRGMAKAFHSAVSMFAPALVADASRVSDSASILRIPGTYNLKNGEAVKVTVDQWNDAELDYEETKVKLARFTTKSAPSKALEHLTAPKEYEPVALLSVAKNCNWTKDYIAHMKDKQEPEWYAMLGLAPYMVHTKPDGEKINGVNVAHILSKGHPDYQHDATVIKFHQAKNAQSGPTTCAKLSSLNPKPCETCPFNGAIRTPLQTAALQRPVTEATVVTTTVKTDEGDTEEETVTIPLPPEPYFRGNDGGIFVRNKIKNEETGEYESVINRVYDYDLYPVRRYRSEIDEEEKIECHLWLPKDGLRKFKLPAEMLADQKVLAKFLCGRGAVAESGQANQKMLSKYMTDYTRHMQTTHSAETEFSRFGWRNINTDHPIFVVGNGYFDKNGALHPAAFPSYLKDSAKAAATLGTLDEWRKGFNAYIGVPNSEAFQFTALLGFAAPLMALTEYSGVMYNMVADTGVGKSTAMKFMTSVWGQPNPAHVLVNDTNISAFNVIGYLNAIPVAFDEITNMTPAVASDFALNFTGGRGKMRADRNGQNRANTTEWDTIVVCTSNTSMYDKFTTARKGYSAEAMRLFEVKVPEMPKSESIKYMPRLDKATEIMSNNYGVAGREYIPYVIRNRDAIRKAIETKTKQILAVTGASNAERFWATLLACFYVGSTIAKAKKLHDYDIEGLLKWATGQVHEARVSVGKANSDPVAILGEFFNANVDSIIRIKDGHPDLSVAGNAPRHIRGRIELKGDVVEVGYVSAKALSDYCKDSNIDRAWLVGELTNAGLVSVCSKRLATGTKLHNPVVACLKIDFTKPQLTINI
ncbi:MAG: DUF927 domain-containing protein [Bacteroidota bacterium]